MRKPAKDPIREDRIHNEAIVDAYFVRQPASPLLRFVTFEEQVFGPLPDENSPQGALPETRTIIAIAPACG